MDRFVHFVDAHVHLSSGEGLRTVVEAGIGAVRNAGRIRPEAGQTECIRAETPVVVTSCHALYKRGGYGARLGIGVETRAEIRDEIVRLKKMGADIIKVMASGMVSLKNPGTITTGGFNREELVCIVEESARLGLAVMAHANGEQAIVAAAEAGVRSIEHGFFMTDRALERMAEKSVWWVPTTGALARAAEAPGLPEVSGKIASGLIAMHLRMLQRAREMELKLAVGTDCVLPDPGYRVAYDAELLYFEQAGFAPDEVRRIACEEGARLLGIA